MDPQSIIGIVSPNGVKIDLAHLNDRTRAAARTCVEAGIMRGYDGAGKLIYEPGPVAPPSETGTGLAQTILPAAEDQPAAAAEPAAADGSQTENVEVKSEEPQKAAEKSETAKGDDGEITPEQEK